MKKTKPTATEVESTEEKKSSGFGFCPKCGSGLLIKDGITTNTGSEKQRYTCKDGTCGHRTTSPLPKPPPDAIQMRKEVPPAKR